MKFSQLFLPLLLCILLAGCGGDDPVQPEPVPSAPAQFGAGPVTPTSITLTWETPAEGLRQTGSGKGPNSILALAGYKLSYADTTIAGIDKSATSYTVTNLTPNTNYTFTLKALNTKGEESVAATFSVATPPLPNPAPPADFRTIEVSFTTVYLAWTASTSASWSDFEGYVLSYNGQDITLSSTATSYTVSGLAAGTLHTFAIRARTTDGRESELVSTSATTHDNTPPPANPTGLKATAESAAAIRLVWTASPDAGEPNFAGYELTYTPGGTQDPILIDKNLTAYTAHGLTAGTVYTFTLRSRSTSGKKSSGISAAWSPARTSDIIRLYGSKSAFGHGVDLDGHNGSPEVLTIANGADWDLAYDDRGGSFIGSPGQTVYVNDEYKFPTGELSKLTYTASERYYVSNLAEIGDGAPLDAGTLEQLQIIDGDKSFGFVIKTAEGNYAKILVLANGGKIVQGSGNDTYIEIQVSYQPAPNVPYAGTSGSGTKGTPGATRQRRPSR